jgi:hypothetical protein
MMLEHGQSSIKIEVKYSDNYKVSKEHCKEIKMDRIKNQKSQNN